jgi:hypothetical protein
MDHGSRIPLSFRKWFGRRESALDSENGEDVSRRLSASQRPKHKEREIHVNRNWSAAVESGRAGVITGKNVDFGIFGKV